MLAEIYAAGGQRDESFRWLSNAIRLRVANTRYMTQQSPFFVPFRNDDEFKQLVGSVGR
jgi:hypothetical protein